MLDSPSEDSFDSLTRLVRRFLTTPVSLLSLVDADRQFFKSAQGLPEPWASRRETPLSHSFCQYVVESEAPLVVEDATQHEELRDNFAVRDLNVIAYLGLPVRAPDGTAVGSLCAIDHQPRRWTPDEVSIVKDLAASASAQVAAVVHARERSKTYAEMLSVQEALERRVQVRTRALKRMNQELKRRNGELQEFAFVASHDLREPLRKVSTFSDLLIDEYAALLGEQGRYVLTRIQSSSLRMQQLLDGLLAFSRASTGRQTLASTELGEVMEHVLDNLRLLIEETDAVVVVDPLPSVVADPEQMQRLLTNLLENALKYRRPGVRPTVSVSATTEGDTDESRRHRIEVRDNGIGFDPKYGRRIFLPFERLHGQSGTPGTGMGLTICRRIVERHRGRIDVTSTPGEGSCFTVVLPAAT